MADLEDLGFIASPHTSAGRIPTARGYRFFVDTLLTLKPLDSIRDQPGGRTIARREPPAARHFGFAGTLRSDAICRRGHHTPAQCGLPAHRIRETVRKPDPADPRDARRRRAEPHLPHRPQVHAGGARRGSEHPQSELRRPHVRGNARPHPRRAEAAARGHDVPHDEGAGRRQPSRHRLFGGCRDLGGRKAARSAGPFLGHAATAQACSICSSARRGFCSYSTCPAGRTVCRFSSAESRGSCRSTSAAS